MSGNQDLLLTKNKPGRKILISYLLGFLICAVLSTLSYDIVQHRVFSDDHLYVLLILSILVQLLTQVICFLRLTYRSEEGLWNLMAFVFTIFVIVILVVGTMWIMYNLNYYMVH